ncbi:MAG: hypothetical protein JOZ83_11655 [Silvibacterium sp.]|nr:hypothetical protein [Silvibacterium sp.]
MDEQTLLEQGRQRAIKVSGFGEGPELVDKPGGSGRRAEEVRQQAEPLGYRFCEAAALSTSFVLHSAFKAEQLAFVPKGSDTAEFRFQITPVSSDARYGSDSEIVAGLS